MRIAEIKGALVAVTAMCLWCILLYGAGQTENYTRAIGVRFIGGSASEGISPAALNRYEGYFRQDGMEIPDAALWKEYPKQELISEKYEKTSADATVILIYGNAENVSVSSILSGGYPVKGDTAGCVISEKAAFDLWGGRDVLGMSLSIKSEVSSLSKRYYVYGVAAGEDSFIICQSDDDSDEIFPYLSLVFKEPGYAKAENYLKRAGLTKGEVFDFPLYGWFIKSMSFIPVILLSLIIISKLIKQGIRSRSDFKSLLRYSAFALPLGGATVAVMLSGERIPTEIIPTKLSDFDAYINLWDGHTENIKQWLSFPTGRDIVIWTDMLILLFLVMIITAVIAIAATLLKIRSYRGMLAGSLAALGIMLSMVIIFSDKGGISIPSAVWITPVLWVINEYGLYRYGEILSRGKSDEKQRE